MSRLTISWPAEWAPRQSVRPSGLPGSYLSQLSAIRGDPLSAPIHEQIENLAGFGMPSSLCLRVDEVPIDRYIEDAFGACREGEGPHDVLVSRHDVVGRAHGAVEIVSRDAVDDLDVMHDRQGSRTTFVGGRGDFELTRAAVRWSSAVTSASSLAQRRNRARSEL